MLGHLRAAGAVGGDEVDRGRVAHAVAEDVVWDAAGELGRRVGVERRAADRLPGIGVGDHVDRRLPLGLEAVALRQDPALGLAVDVGHLVAQVLRQPPVGAEHAAQRLARVLLGVDAEVEVVARHEHAVGRGRILEIRGRGARHDRVADRLRHERVVGGHEQVEVEGRLRERARGRARVLALGEHAQPVADVEVRDHVGDVPVDVGEQVALVAVDHRARAALRVAARALEHEAAIVGLSRALEIRQQVEVDVDGAHARAVGVAHVVVRHQVRQVGRVVEIVLVLVQVGGVGVAQVAAVLVGDPRVRTVLVRQRDVAAALGEVLARGERQEQVVAVAEVGDTALRTRGDPLEVVLHPEVHHARDAVRAVDRRGAAREHVHRLDQVGRDRVDVDRGRAGDARHVAASVDQHERAVGAEVAQVEQFEARLAELGIGAGRQVTRERAHQRRALDQEVGDVRAAGLHDRLRRDRHDRIGEVGLRARDARAGDHDLLETGLARGRRPGLLGRSGQRRQYPGGEG